MDLATARRIYRDQKASKRNGLLRIGQERGRAKRKATINHRKQLVKQMHEEGRTKEEMMDMLGVTRSTINAYIRS